MPIAQEDYEAIGEYVRLNLSGWAAGAELFQTASRL